MIFGAGDQNKKLSSAAGRPKDTSYRKNLLIQFTKIHRQLQQNTSYRLNKIILKFIK